MGKITGLYRFRMKDKDGNIKLAYCYTETDEFDVLHFNFTEDLEKVRKVFVKYANDNGYKKADLNSIEGTDSFDLNCSSPIDVFNKIERANRGKTILIEWFVGNYAFFLDPFNLHDMDLGTGEKGPEKARKSKKSSGFDEDEDLGLTENNAEDLDDDFDDEENLEEDFDDEDDLDETEALTEDEFKDKFPTRVRKFFESKLTALKNKWNSLNPKTKVGFIGAGMAALSVAIAIGASVAVNKFGGPTATNSRVASVTDDNDKDKNKDQNDKKDEQETKDEDQKEKENEASKQNTGDSSSTSTDNSYGQSSSNSNSNSGSGSSSNGGGSSSGGTSGGGSTGSTTTPGSINEDVPVFQNPDESLDNSNNGGSSDEEAEDPYENVNEGEQDTNIGEGEQPDQDEDYSEEIDVPPSTEDKDNVDKDDVDFNDELTGNEDAVDDDDLSYDMDVPLGQGDSEDYEVTPAPLPDPNDTAVAGDGDYNTTEDELNNVTEEEVNTTTPTTPDQSQTEDYSEEIDVVPVTQELVEPEGQYVDQDAELAARQEANANAVEQAVNEMAEGNDVSLIFNDQTGTVSIEQNTTTNTQTNSMTK